jgi:hypothetical protein
MHIFKENVTELSSWIREEIELDQDVSFGARGSAVKRIQEWLIFHGAGVSIDSDYGAATQRAVQRFQEAAGLPATGVVDGATFQRLVQPMRNVLSQRSSMLASTSLERAVLEYADVHLQQHPREIGGQNKGPWVRLYMKGHEGPQWPWCAGFVSFVIRQAVESLNARPPIEGSFSCDSLAAQARAAGLFLPERDVVRGQVPAGAIFLVRRTAGDWTHTGLVKRAEGEAFDTIEGNTNDEGSRDGFEVCSNARGYKDKDFILLSA